ncbi:MAG: hypothetical protein S0880_13200 [Actinomycetota bacterium]|nr:hypothetical protein [Actinomycetota bacterium]
MAGRTAWWTTLTAATVAVLVFVATLGTAAGDTPAPASAWDTAPLCTHQPDEPRPCIVDPAVNPDPRWETP